MNNFLKILLLSIAICASQGASALSSIVKNAIDTLDIVLKQQPEALALRYSHVDSLKASPGRNAMRFKSIADSYRGLDNDSAIHYYNKALDCARLERNDGLVRYILPELAERLAKASRFKEAFMTVDTLSIADWARNEKVHYYSSLGHVYLDAEATINLPYSHEAHHNGAVECLDSLEMLIGNPSAVSLIKAQKYFLKNEPTLALGELNEVFEHQDPFSPEYALVANMLASYYKDKPEHTEEYIYYLTLSAITDARRANGEAVSLARLGEELLRLGDTERALSYLATASELIEKSNSLVYGPELTPSLARFARIWSERTTHTHTAFVVAIILLSIIVIVLSFFLWRSLAVGRKETQQMQKLSNSLINRDHYISQLLNLCGVYVEGLEEFNRLVARKLKVNQVQDLYKMIESGKLLQEHTENFFEVFDDAVFKIFPNFIDEVNSLLVKEKHVFPLQGNRLTPELRIIAFMRLGVTDSARLSKFLGLSVNTIYTYRNRMKSRAKNREMFEDDIINLGRNL